MDKKINKSEELLINLKNNLDEMKNLHEKISGHWYMEDGVYRFYHQSFKVYSLQDYTVQIFTLLKKCAVEGCVYDKWFMEIFKEGTTKKFHSSHNRNWLKHTRPIIEAFFHAKYFLEMAIKYAQELEEVPIALPSGFAALLYLYGLRYES